jgi:hypothetical protein
MLESNNLVVRGKASEVDKLVERLGAGTGHGAWRRELGIERSLRASGRGRFGIFCFAMAGGSGLPPASLLVFRTDPGELALTSSSIVPAERRSLTDEESNGILASFEENIIRPLVEGLDLVTTISPPHGNRLEWSLSPAAFSKLNWFVSMASNPADLTTDDRTRWDDFWAQTYSDGSLVEDRDLAKWLEEQDFPEGQVSSLIARKDAGVLLDQHGGI